ncbi:MAG TPA: 1-deoxy-D-xylulose-5-phosphate synthase [candidate division WOR-3 bacterium]|uniref:1-deoxy-D-xylulose-5-phosphate synthase n=1 Tax=candidate division WOR-3 bacterium TaxID=2052148 RepID=A0A7C0VEE1_UNCW3|nr:1-deoxy-D-xylulose-5-phosphate synthase [candidate division WOR-3 bacterium]
MLEKVNFPSDVKGLSIKELQELASDLRKEIIRVTSKNGGHVAPNLGAVELVIALAYVFDQPVDKVIWDVGHQAYAHKLITGRKKAFDTLRQYGGISGFLKRDESIYDVFGAGHASTSISAALGFSVSRDMKKEDHHIVVVVGDGALTGGMALEGLNQLGHLRKNMLVILNDNKMSISPNVGGLKNYLIKLQSAPVYNRLKDDVWDLLGKLPAGLSQKAREAASKVSEGLKNLLVPNLLFEELGIRYFGPIDGHNLPELIEILKKLKNIKGPKLLHVLTVKGKGFEPAEKMPTLFHGLGKYDPETGRPLKKGGTPSYSKVFGRTLTDLGKTDQKVIAITAAMPEGTGLDIFREEIPERFYDVGIAEQHAVTFAAGMAASGLKPFCAIYSTFLQRAFDQIIHDVAIQNLPVKFALDRGGIVGEDGPTHHGVFDLSYLRIIPNMIVMAPKDEAELQRMIKTALDYDEGPIAFRYPRGRGLGVKLYEKPEPIPIGTWEVLKEGEDVLILAVGSMVQPSLEATELLKGINPTVVNARFIKPIDEELLRKLIKNHKIIVTVEDNALMGGFGSAILETLNRWRIKRDVLNLGIPDRFIEHGARTLLLEKLGLSKEGIALKIEEFINAG